MVKYTLALRCLRYLIGTTAIATALASSLPQVNSSRYQSATRAVTAMDPHIYSFIRSLDLPNAQADAVANVFSDNLNIAAFLHGKPYESSMLTSAAQAALKLVLGDVKVETKPVDTTIVDDNWSVPLFLVFTSSPFVLTWRSQVANMLEVA